MENIDNLMQEKYRVISPCARCERRQDCAFSSRPCKKWREWFSRRWKEVRALYAKQERGADGE